MDKTREERVRSKGYVDGQVGDMNKSFVYESADERRAYDEEYVRGRREAADALSARWGKK